MKSRIDRDLRGRGARPGPQARPRSRVRRRLLLVAAGLLLAAAAPPTPAPAATAPAGRRAPLDTLLTAPPVPSWRQAGFSISRRVLPDVPATSLPRGETPLRPPRLDDPLAAEHDLHLARTALAAADYAGAMARVEAAVVADPGLDRARWWATGIALQHLDLAALAGLAPAAVRTSLADPLAWRRLLLTAHQALLAYLLILWSLVVISLLFRYRDHLGHDLGVLLLRGGHVSRPGLAWLLPLAVVVLRPGWPAAAALLSLPVMVLARRREKVLVGALWLAIAALLAPVWTPLREAVPVIDPASETCLLERACRLEARSDIVGSLQARIARAEDPERSARLQFALAVQKARQGEYEASSRLFRGVLRAAPQHVPSLVGLANNTYYLGAFDAAIEDFRRAEQMAPQRGEIPYNLAQAYFKKLFLPEASEALKRARERGFDPPPWPEAGERGDEFSPVVYLGLEPADLAASARQEAPLYPEMPHLAAWHLLLGGPPGQVAVLLTGTFLLSILLGALGSRQAAPRTCHNCGRAICRACGRARDGAWLCSGCGETADRSRSEFVLATLLKNRRRSLDLARASGLRRFGRLLPGGGHLAAGQFGAGLVRLGLLATSLFLLLVAWSFDLASRWPTPGLLLPEETIHPVWLPLPAVRAPHLTSAPVLAGAILLAALYLLAQLEAAAVRRSPERFRARDRGVAARHSTQRG